MFAVAANSRRGRARPGLVVLGLEAWVIQDGNYPDFRRGQVAEFAVGTRFLEAPVAARRASGSCRRVSGAVHDLTGTVLAVFDHTWVLDCGFGVLVNGPPPEGLSPGDTVAGRAALGVDPFFYGGLAGVPGMPPLIYRWRIDGVLMQAAPWVEEGGRPVRDPSRSAHLPLEATNARQDNGGFASYCLECSRLLAPPRRWPGP
ncbi:MAG: hypothetical protein ACRDJU_06565 [Actinomycetota bacterium]